MNILVINIHSSTNAGDAALMLQTIAGLQSSFPGCSLTLAMDDPASHDGPERKVGSLLHWLKSTQRGATSRWNMRNLLVFLPASVISLLVHALFKRRVFPFMTPAQRDSISAYFDADLVVSKPGGFIYTGSGLGLPFLLTLYTIAFALGCGKPHYMLPQSIGPVSRGWQRRLARWALNHTRITMLRESISVREVQSMGVDPARYAEVADLAFAYPPAAAEDARAWLRRHGVGMDSAQPRIGVTAINWAAQENTFGLQQQYEAALAEALAAFAGKIGAQLVFFPQVIGPTVEQDDRVVARRVAESMPGSDLVLIDAQPAPDVMKAAIGMMDLLVGTRMHSNIFALSGGVPVVAIGYLHKTRGIMHLLGLQDCVIDIGDINAGALAAKIQQVWDARADLRQRIMLQAERMRQSASTATEQIRADAAALRAAQSNGAPHA
jgi:colanic acid/amylovoran biosynthesis protein